MKYTQQQKDFIKRHKLDGITSYKKQETQEDLQKFIDNHYPIKEMEPYFEIYQSKINGT